MLVPPQDDLGIPVVEEIDIFEGLPSGLRVRSGEELRADASLAGDIEWLVEGMFPFGGLSVVYGLPKSGKTTLVMNATARIVKGHAFLGRATDCCEVLWLDLEQHERLTRRKIEEEGALDGLAQVWAYNGIPPKILDVEATIVRKNIRLVVVDSLSSLLMLEDENDNAEITRRIAPWRDLVHDRNLAFIAIHHSRKSEGTFGVGMRGGNAILAISDVAMEVKRQHSESEEDDGRRKLVCVSRYDEANETLTVQRVDNEFLLEPGPREKRRKAVQAALSSSPQDAPMLAKRLRLRRKAVEDILQALCLSGVAWRGGTGTKGSPFSYSLVPVPTVTGAVLPRVSG